MKKILVVIFFLASTLIAVAAGIVEENKIVRKTVIVQKGKESFSIIYDQKSIEIMEKVFPHGRRFGALKEELYCSVKNGYITNFVPGKCK